MPCSIYLPVLTAGWASTESCTFLEKLGHDMLGPRLPPITVKNAASDRYHVSRSDQKSIAASARRADDVCMRLKSVRASQKLDNTEFEV
jgi:hypothetical protein